MLSFSSEYINMEISNKEHLGFMQTLQVILDIFFGKGIEVWDEDYRREHHLGWHGEQLT